MNYLATTFATPSMDFEGLAQSVIEGSGGAITAGLVLFGLVIAVGFGKKLFKKAS